METTDVLFLIQRPQRDSNPCYSLERAVSWAWLDDGDRAEAGRGI
jgi:hypothetical protein